MNRTQRVLLAIYVPFIIFSHIFTVLYANTDPVLFFKFTLRITMLLTVLALMNWKREGILVFLAFLSSVFSDYFLILAVSFDYEIPNRLPIGMLGFIMAYIFLIAAFSRNFRLRKMELFALLPFAAAFTIIFLQLAQYAEGIMFIAGLILGIVLCTYGMVLVSTLFRGTYTGKAAVMIALSAIFAFGSDMVVAFDIYHPAFRGFILWKENTVWATYMISWTLLLIILAEDKLYATEQQTQAEGHRMPNFHGFSLSS